MRLALLVLIVVLATATSAAAQTGEPLDTVTVGPNVEVVGSHELKAGTTYTAVITGQVTKTFHNAGGVTTDLDGFYCFASNDPRVCQSQENPTETLYASTTGQAGDTTMGSRVEPTHKAPPYRSDHIYTVAVRFTYAGKLRLSTKPQCSVGGTSCSGPGYTVKLYAAESTRCASRGANAFAAQEFDFCFGATTTVAAPSGEAAIVTPDPTPAKVDAADLFLALRELAFQEEVEELDASIAARLTGQEIKTIQACIFFGRDLQLPPYERFAKVFKACVGLLEKADGDDRSPARGAAGGCEAVVVPLFPKGSKVTKRKLKLARAAARRQIAASCSARKGKLSVSIRARGAKKLRAITGRRIQTAVTHRKPNAKADGPDRELTVRWRARKG